VDRPGAARVGRVEQAGAIGIIETSSGELDAVRDEIRKMRDLTDKPFGVNIAQAFVRDPAIVEFVIDQGVKFVTTSAGSPTKYTSRAQGCRPRRLSRRAHPEGALKAVDAGVDGLIVEGGEGGGFKSPTPVSTMVLLPLVRSKVDVPIIAAGGITDGPRWPPPSPSAPRASRWERAWSRPPSRRCTPTGSNAIVDAAETDTVFLNRFGPGPALRALRTERTTALVDAEHNVFGDFGDPQALYFGGDMNAAIALSGQVAGRVESVEPVSRIIDDTVAEFAATVARLSE
jgi:enoyl-[acyl-carrier protein] reductase II